MSEHEPLSPDLAELFAKEKDGYAHYEAAKGAALARVLERVALVGSLATPTDEPAAAAATTTAKAGAVVSAKTALLIAAGSLLVGGAIGRATAPAPAPAPSASVVTVATTSPVLSVATAAPAESAAPTVTTASASAARSFGTAPSVSAPSASSHAIHGTLAQERDLVEASRTALARQRPADALAAADLHAREFPHGQLAEEREVLAITALISLGRNADARARRTRFLHDFPNSMLSPPIPPAEGP